MTDDDQLLDTKEAAKLLGVKPETLEQWRTTKRYPLPYLKIGRSVKYLKSRVVGFRMANELTA